MKKILMILLTCMFLFGCGGFGLKFKEAVKCFWGSSTKELEDCRKDALIKVIDYDYNTCYAKTEEIIKKMPHTSIYAKNKEMIALYYINPNNTAVGIFFKEIDATHAQVEVSSSSSYAKESVAKYIFSKLIKSKSIVSDKLPSESI